MVLHVVVDNSGSMTEGGRRFIERTAIRQLDRFLRKKRNSVALKLYVLSATLQECVWSRDDEVPDAIIHPHGRMCLDPLGQATIAQDNRIVLITDNPANRDLRDWLTLRSTAVARVLIVGGDMDYDLRQKGIYTMDQIDDLLTGWFDGAEQNG